MPKTQMTPSDTVFYKLYLVNLLHTGEGKFETLNHAEILGNKVALICKKLTGEEVKQLVDRIENKL